MIKQPVDLSADEIGRTIDRLSRDVADLRRNGPLSLHDVQRLAIVLTKAQLKLNELERVELQRRGVSRELAARHAELEHGIRSLREDLRRDLHNRGADQPSRSDDGNDPAG